MAIYMKMFSKIILQQETWLYIKHTRYEISKNTNVTLNDRELKTQIVSISLFAGMPLLGLPDLSFLSGDDSTFSDTGKLITGSPGD